MQHDQAAVEEDVVIDLNNPLDPHENLFVTTRKRFVPVYNPVQGGGKELTLYCGVHEISFDEPDLFPWAEKLIQQESFMAGTATTWSTEPLEWSRVKPLLESLLEAGILARESAPKSAAQVALSAAHHAFLESERARPATEVPRFWNPDPGSLLQEITGRSIEPGYIESIVPVHRIAHIALDQEGRQVGEANSFPDRMRLKLPTEYKTCGYAGTRYLDDMPMNMTALRSMLAHWKPVLRATLLFREEFLRRYPQYPDGSWKVGDLHFMTSGVLALPAIQTMRWRNPVPNGELDPVLSSLFRVIDGIRMVSAYMLDLYERPMTHDTPVRPRDISGAAEREDQYRSGRGVCAGPPAMIDELIETVMNGKPVAGTDGQPGPWIADIPQALDYGLLGRQLAATISTVWVKMGGAYQHILDALRRMPDLNGGRLGRLRTAIERDFLTIVPGRNHQPQQRAWSYAWHKLTFERAQLGIRGLAEADRVNFDVILNPPSELLGKDALGALQDLFASTEEPGEVAANGALLQEIAGYVVDYLRFERNALTTIVSIQRRINALLERPHPSAPFNNQQLAIFHSLRVGTPGAAVYLLDPLKEALGIEVENREDSTTVSFGGRAIVLR
ncbi:MAG TPA: hypothetical protein VGH20_16510 [Myxococcales bacterium]|jgi:hypothetical protein